MELIIEEISRGHKLLGRHKFFKDNICVGRGYNNDIILDDPHVCPEHLSLEFDGTHWLVKDDNSINGSFLEDGKRNADQHIVNSGDVITFGKSQIRVVFPDHPVAQSVAFSPFESLINFARHPGVLAASVLIFAFVAGFIFYLNKPLEVTFTQFLVPAIGLSILFAMWPLGVSLVSHLTKHEARVFSQIGVSFIFFNLMWISDVFESFISFNLSANWPIAGLITLIPIVLSFCLFWLNCYIGFHMTERRRIVVSAAITALLFGGSFIVQVSNKPEFSAHPNYNATIMSPTFLLSSGSDVDTFIEDSSRLFDKVKKKAQQDEKK